MQNVEINKFSKEISLSDHFNYNASTLNLLTKQFEEKIVTTFHTNSQICTLQKIISLRKRTKYGTCLDAFKFKEKLRKHYKIATLLLTAMLHSIDFQQWGPLGNGYSPLIS